MEVLAAVTTEQVQAAIADALAARTPLEILAGGSKTGLGRPGAAARRLDVSGLTGILDYDPDELTLTARPGTRLSEIAPMLAARRQMLAFEPPALHRLYGTDGEPTLGGVLAAGLAGPRRIRAGGARDHLLGFSAVNGRAEAWRGGGRVVKNVSGYDMPKLQCGAFGTLSVLTELCLRLVPAPETSLTLLVAADTQAAAGGIMARALNLPQEVSAAACLPDAIAARAGLPRFAPHLVVLRLEGSGASVVDRAAALDREFPVVGELADEGSVLLWQAVGAVAPLLPDPDAIIWRLCPPPARAAEILVALGPLAEHAYLDWGGGLIWLALPDAPPDGAAATLRAALGPDGHATLIRGPAMLRATIPVFPPMSPPLAALNARIRAAFDPALLLNRGRLAREP